jgi:hypothetical protein
MQVVRKEIGVYPTARHRFIEPPRECVDAKTIFLNEVKVLTLFKDRRLLAVYYIREILHAIGAPNPDKMVQWFYHEMPSSGYLEMDYLTGRLSFCFVEKI